MADSDQPGLTPLGLTPDGNGVILQHSDGGQAVLPRNWLPNLKLEGFEDRDSQRKSDSDSSTAPKQEDFDNLLGILSKANNSASAPTTGTDLATGNAAPPSPAAGPPPPQVPTPGTTVGEGAPPPAPPAQPGSGYTFPPMDLKSGKPALPTMADVTSQIKSGTTAEQAAIDQQLKADQAATSAQQPVLDAQANAEIADQKQMQAAQQHINELATQHYQTGLQRAQELHDQATKADDYMGWWNNRGIGTNMVTALGLLISGVDGANKYIQNNVNNWTNAQKEKFEQLKGTGEAEDTIYGQARAMGMDDLTALKYTNAHGKMMFGAMAQRVANGMKNPQLAATAAQASAKAGMDGAQDLQKALLSHTEQQKNKAEANLHNQMANLTGLQAQYYPLTKQMEFDKNVVDIPGAPKLDKNGKEIVNPDTGETETGEQSHVVAKSDNDREQLLRKIAAGNMLLDKINEMRKVHGDIGGPANAPVNLIPAAINAVSGGRIKLGGNLATANTLSESGGGLVNGLTGDPTGRGPAAMSLNKAIKDIDLLSPTSRKESFNILERQVRNMMKQAIPQHTWPNRYQREFGTTLNQLAEKNRVREKK